MESGKLEAQKTWGASPTGWTSASGLTPGTEEFFEAARRFRDAEEQPWLADVVPFALTREKRVLEIGFGPGYDALKFLESGAIYSGIDITPENIERTKRHLAPFGFQPDVHLGDAENLPFANATFDFAYSNGVLHHVPDMKKAFSEVARVLRPRSDFYVLLYNRRSLFYGTVVLLHWLSGGWMHETLARRRSRIEFTTADAAPLVNVYSPTEVRNLLQAAGFDVISTNVRKFTAEDLPGARLLRGIYRRIPKSLYDWLGQRIGWYVIGHGRLQS